MPLKKTILKIHSWLGLLSGLVVFILGITGCIYVFMEEIKPVVYHQRLFVEVPENKQRLPIAVITAKAQEAVGITYPLQLAEVPQAANRSFMFRAVKTNPDALLYATYMEYFYRVYVNPYTGEILKVENTKWEFFNTIVNLHINLLLGPKIGGTIVNWSVIIFIVMLVSGIILWWPAGKAAAKQRFRFRWKKDTKWKRKNYDLHNILGFYAMLILLVIALTGLVISYPWFSNAVQWLGNGGKKTTPPPAVFADTTATQILPLDHIITNANNRVPQGSTLLITLPKDKNAVVSVFARRDGKPLYHATRMKYDQHTATPLWSRSFADMTGGERLQAMNYDIHVGAVMGLPGKILAFLASLIAASLPVTGFYIWWGRKNKKKPAYKSRTMPQQQRA
ncbi:putative iron-regulated membrane protein [Chitinophaga dinghuensis]|uniref:Putative iron-regulated membrane protein n=1 Tax=Chitinophaga dinghuensis TaxID=1539050 RepID=A0A327W2D7_9BACT|nr:PepSY-associated TM helix domain-containing protein [Chitinophaga dinghuensis]RAJ79098.1 putative iron-regulated membrane protein [Chitinophaga dinghuensis]